MSASHQSVRDAIKHGCVWIRVSGRASAPRYWRVRVNGATKLWKRDLFRYRIPVKAGMNVYNEITNETEIGTFDSTAAFLYSETDPNTCPHRRAIAQAGALVQGPRL